MSLSAVLAEAWEQAVRTTEDPLRSWALTNLFDRKPYSVPYRDYLDRVRYNWLGEPIPRIEIVKANLRRLGSIRLDARRLR